MVEQGETGLSWKGRVGGAGTVDDAPGRARHGGDGLWGHRGEQPFGPRDFRSCGYPKARKEGREGREAGLFRRERKWCGESAPEAARGAGMRRGPRAPGST